LLEICSRTRRARCAHHWCREQGGAGRSDPANRGRMSLGREVENILTAEDAEFAEKSKTPTAKCAKNAKIAKTEQKTFKRRTGNSARATAPVQHPPCNAISATC